jgi:hypothetical protein
MELASTPEISVVEHHLLSARKRFLSAKCLSQADIFQGCRN